MKKTWNGEFLQGLKELTSEDEVTITGGESLWYWVGYAAGMTVYMLTHLNSYQSSGQQAMNGALG